MKLPSTDLITKLLSDPSRMEAFKIILDKAGPESIRQQKREHALVSYDIPPIPDDFYDLQPGTEMWKRYWVERPEEQESMLAWKGGQNADQH